MKTSKKLLTGIILVLTLMLCLAFGVSAEETFTEGYYTYTVTDGEATITNVNYYLQGNVVIPDYLGGYPVTAIDDYGFIGSGNLTSVTIGKNIKSIGQEAFYGYYELESVTIENSVEKIGVRAFKDCASLININISDNVKSIGTLAFSNTGFYKDKTNWEDGVLYIGKHLIDIEMDGDGYGFVEEYSVKDGTKTIADGAFAYCLTLENITIPDSVKSIGKRAFAQCEKLTNVVIPDSVTFIDESVFSDCYSLESIKLGKGIKNIPDYAFFVCDNLESLTLGDNIETIGFKAFSFCTLKEITLPDSVTIIDEYAFWRSSIKNIKLSYNLKEIGKYAFCSSDVVSIEIPDSVTSVGEYAFSQCKSLTDVKMGSGVTEIENGTYEYCDNLENVTIGENVTDLGYRSFDHCTNLSNVTLPEGLLAVGEYAFDSSGLTSIIIPVSVTSINEGAFAYCRKLKTIVMPKTVTKIDECAFRDCDGLSDVYYSGSEEDWNKIIIAEYGNEPLTTATIHYNNKQITVTDGTGVKATYPSGTFAEGTELVINQTSINANYAFEDEYEKYIPYDIFFVLNGEKVQPNGTVTVKIPVPADFSAEHCIVYYLDINGNRTIISSRYENGYIIFETDHFSEYVLVDESSRITDEPDAPDAPDTPDTPDADCSHMCHESGFMGFIWKIICFFQKLFKTNPVCECGVAHY